MLQQSRHCVCCICLYIFNNHKNLDLYRSKIAKYFPISCLPCWSIKLSFRNLMYFRLKLKKIKISIYWATTTCIDIMLNNFSRIISWLIMVHLKVITISCGRENGPPKMSMCKSLECVIILCYMAKGLCRFGSQTLKVRKYPGLSSWAQYKHMNP